MTFEQIPNALDELSTRLNRIETLLVEQQTKPELGRHFSLSEAARYCNLPEPTFRTHLHKRNVVGSKPGKRWIFSKSDLDDFLESFKTKKKLKNIDDFLVNQRNNG